MVILPWLYAVFGLIIGSFLNVCIFRIPRGESIVFPASHCPNCGAKIRPYDNVPVLSYLWLLGRCRSCRQPVSLQYPAVEILNGAAYYFCALKWGAAAPTLVNSLLLSVLIVLVFIDWQHQILPNVLTLPGAALGILLSPLQTSSLFSDPLTFGIASLIRQEPPAWILNPVGSALGALVGAGILEVVAILYKAVRKQQGLGMGDVKMMALVGAFLGWRVALLTIFAGSFIGSLTGIFLILFKGSNLQTRLAFGTFLGIGAALALFFGPSFIRWYAGVR